MYKLLKIIQSYVGNIKVGKQLEKKTIQTTKILPPPIFVIGLPRSGSTLLYQIISTHFSVSFFSNLLSFFFGYPATIALLTKYFHLHSRIKKYSSNYGVTPGIFSPSEAGAIYRLWFSDDSLISDEYIKNTINKISETLQKRPFVWKNLNLSTKIERLANIFPNAIFIKVDRRLEYVSQSIYLKTKNDDGIHIQGFEKDELKKSDNLLEIVIDRVIDFENQINNQLSKINNRILTISYEKLCLNTVEIIKLIEIEYNKSDFVLKTTKKDFNFNLYPQEKVLLNKEQWNQVLEKIHGGKQN